MSATTNYEHISALMENFREFVLEIQEEQQELREKLKQFPLPVASRQRKTNCGNLDNNNNRQLQEQQQSHHHHHSHRQRQLSNNTNASTATYSIEPTIPTTLPSDEPSTATTVSSGTLSSATATSGSTRPPPYKAVIDHNHNSDRQNHHHHHHHSHHHNNKPHQKTVSNTREQEQQRKQDEDSSSPDTQQTQSPTPPVRPVRKRATLPATNRTSATIINSKHQHINSTRTMSSAAATTAASMTVRRGALIVLEGLDRVGKSTLAEKLVDHLERIRKPVSHYRFPDRTTPIGGLIDDFLKNSFKRVDDHAMHLLFSANRWELNKRIRNKLTRGVTVIVDRYSYSGIAYSSAKRDIDMEWCRESEKGLPKPDLVIYLELPKEVRSKRPGFGDERYENEELQELIRHRYEQLMDISSELWLRVDVENKSPDQVLGEIIVPVKHCLEACAHKELGSLEFL